ncbi:hypothetical protein B0O99DRAFT_592453 [Bisporella sp. PMI_857]|nr:hypothetical protein B0O99DRAFT_592453 [Bisporella sp. PMI_857]
MDLAVVSEKVKQGMRTLAAWLEETEGNYKIPHTSLNKQYNLSIAGIERMHMELLNACHQVEMSKAEYMVKNNQVESKLQQLGSINEQVPAMHQSISQLRTEIKDKVTKAVQDSDQAEMECKRVKLDLAKMVANKSKFSDKLTMSEKMNLDLVKRNSELVGRAKQLESDNARLIKDTAGYVSSLEASGIENARLSTRLEESKLRISQFGQSNTALETRLQSYIQANARLETQMSQLKDENVALTTRLQALLTEKTNLTTRLGELETQFSQLNEQNTQVKSRLENALSENAQLTTQLEEVGEQKAQISEENTILDNRIEKYVCHNTELIKCSEGAYEDNKKLQNRIQEFEKGMSDLTNVNEERDRTIALLQDKLQAADNVTSLKEVTMGKLAEMDALLRTVIKEALIGFEAQKETRQSLSMELSQCRKSIDEISRREGPVPNLTQIQAVIPTPTMIGTSVWAQSELPGQLSDLKREIVPMINRLASLATIEDVNSVGNRISDIGEQVVALQSTFGANLTIDKFITLTTSIQRLASKVSSMEQSLGKCSPGQDINQKLSDLSATVADLSSCFKDQRSYTMEMAMQALKRVHLQHEVVASEDGREHESSTPTFTPTQQRLSPFPNEHGSFIPDEKLYTKVSRNPRKRLQELSPNTPKTDWDVTRDRVVLAFSVLTPERGANSDSILKCLCKCLMIDVNIKWLQELEESRQWKCLLTTTTKGRAARGHLVDDTGDIRVQCSACQGKERWCVLVRKNSIGEVLVRTVTAKLPQPVTKQGYEGHVHLVPK